MIDRLKRLLALCLLGPEFRQQIARRRVVGNTLVIESPKIGFLNLMGVSAHNILQEDRMALAPMFASFEQRTDNPPPCDVLMVYARIEKNSIAGYPPGLKGIIRGSNAAMVIFASQNENTDGISRGIRKGPIIVFTVSRTGSGFASFYQQLFSKMFSGITMPMAWNQLAPQSLELVHHHIQGYGAFAVRVSHLIFKAQHSEQSA
jgi:hypothetical protein